MVDVDEAFEDDVGGGFIFLVLFGYIVNKLLQSLPCYVHGDPTINFSKGKVNLTPNKLLISYKQMHSLIL